MSDGVEGGSSVERSGPSTSTREHQEPRNHCCVCEEPTTAYGGWLFEDEPPPYASLVGSDHHQLSWSYVYPGPPYEESGEPRSFARPLVSIPLTSYGIFKIEPPRYPATSSTGRNNPTPLQLPHPRLLVEAGPVVKSSTGTARKYGAILIAATVIIFLMALSLMVRFVTEKSLWRG